MNWGNKLLVAFVAFASMIAVLVYKAINTNFDLVEKEYYKSELKYQDVIDGTNRANLLSQSVEYIQNDSALSIQMPEEMREKSLKGNIWFYCAYNASQDKKFELKTNSSGLQTIPDKSILPGNYLVKLTWEQNGLNYYSEKKLTIQ